MDESKTRFVPVADVQRAHGIRGELRVRPFHDGRALFVAGARVLLEMKDGARVAAVVTQARPVPGAILVSFAGVEDRTKAETLRGATVLVDRASFPEPEDDEVYVCDLEGVTVLWGERTLGVVKGVIDYPTCQALLVDMGARKELEVPMLDGFVVEVDVASGRVRVERIDELAPELGPRGP